VYAAARRVALAFAIRLAQQQRIVKTENVPVAHDPHCLQRHMAARRAPGRARFVDGRQRGALGGARRQSAAVLGQQGKYIATEVGIAVTSKVNQGMVGGRGRRNREGQERSEAKRNEKSKPQSEGRNKLSGKGQ